MATEAIRSFRDLRAWQTAMALVIEVYRLSDTFPDREKFALTSQVRRAAVSIPSNIAEGHERRTTREFLQFLAVAQGSRAEIETQLEIAVLLGYASSAKVNEIIAGNAIGLARQIAAGPPIFWTPLPLVAAAARLRRPATGARPAQGLSKLPRPALVESLKRRLR